MILTVTPNPALDVTYRVDALAPGQVHRVREVLVRAGGKGVNVARVLQALGEGCTVLGLGGGPDGDRLAAELVAAGLPVELVAALPDVRRTLVVHGADGVTTSLWEPGRAPADPRAAAERLLAAVSGRLGGARAVTVSGSLPPGVDPALPARIAAACVEAEVPVVLDLDGEALHAAAEAGGAVLMPNADELESLTGQRPTDVREVVALARDLVRRSRPNPAVAVVATLGSRGIAVVTAAHAVRAQPVEAVQGNPTGAGDAACAAVARVLAAAGSLAALDVRRLAAETVAVSAASVLRPVAGEIDLAAYRRWLPRVLVEDV